MRPSPAQRLAVVLVALTQMACSDTPSLGPPDAQPSAAASLSMLTGCGASFRMVATEHDSLMAPYGIATTVDTVDVCETWTGSDYQYQALAVGSSDNVPDLDAVQSVTYDGAGNLTGYDASGVVSAPTENIAPTSFDFLYADDATRQASYDYPYYGIASPDPSTCIDCPAMSLGAAVGASRAPAGDTLPRFARHGLTRLAVRALVDDAQEIAPSPEGFRRFRSVRGAETVIRSVDPKTQLLVAELLAGPTDTMVSRHTWKRVPGGYVRARSESEIVEVIAGRTIRNHSVVAFKRVRVTDPRFPLLVDPEVVR